METKSPNTVPTVPGLSLEKEARKDNKIIDSTLISNELNTLSKQFKEMPAVESDWKQFVIDSTKKISKPKPILIQTSTGITLFNFKNISNTAAAMKVGKTKQNIAFAAAILHTE